MIFQHVNINVDNHQIYKFLYVLDRSSEMPALIRVHIGNEPGFVDIIAFFFVFVFAGVPDNVQNPCGTSRPKYDRGDATPVAQP